MNDFRLRSSVPELLLSDGIFLAVRGRHRKRFLFIVRPVVKRALMQNSERRSRRARKRECIPPLYLACEVVFAGVSLVFIMLWLAEQSRAHHRHPAANSSGDGALFAPASFLHSYARQLFAEHFFRSSALHWHSYGPDPHSR